ncbi:TadE/TadG family type IV pilus assembly protein [Jatrophihabitans endophyticus]|uniref:TadE/TadG family type IV pilus assembly protein n=1 Tax=Jatrophihabitans endophyticus TaxID=1206085 RepID=UPI0026EF009E|nr:TadE/TadG family type IV pilus assembly protein [Jatrophihabitans endophyticus]
MRPPGGDRSADEGSAVVDFVLMSVLLVVLLFAVLQVAVYFYARNVAAESAADAARYAASAGVNPQAGVARAETLLRKGLDDRDAAAIHCTAAPGRDARSGLPTTTVECTGHLRLFFTALRGPLPIDVRSTVLRERAP